MASGIDASVPATDAALASAPVRANFSAAKSEIEALQGLVTGLASVATSGAYTDLSGRPTLPSGAIVGSTVYGSHVGDVA
jgi:hypothetical protein